MILMVHNPWPWELRDVEGHRGDDVAPCQLFQIRNFANLAYMSLVDQMRTNCTWTSDGFSIMLILQRLTQIYELSETSWTATHNHSQNVCQWRMSPLKVETLSLGSLTPVSWNCRFRRAFRIILKLVNFQRHIEYALVKHCDFRV